jgi:hypothetical protein
MNRWRVGEDRGSKEKDRCPLTINARGNSGAHALHMTQVPDKQQGQACLRVAASTL